MKVEVTNCKDCKHCRTGVELLDEGEHVPVNPDLLWCDCGFYRVTENDFCSKAEKKT